jgi:hypothetical protein
MAILSDVTGHPSWGKGVQSAGIHARLSAHGATGSMIPAKMEKAQGGHALACPLWAKSD